MFFFYFLFWFYFRRLPSPNFFFPPFYFKKKCVPLIGLFVLLVENNSASVGHRQEKSVLNQQIFINELRVNDNLLRIHRVIRLISEYEKTQFIKETIDL